MSSPTLPRYMSKAWDIYARELLPLGYGYPLWGPEPDESYGEVRLGDVGYICDGHFNFLFNCMLGGDDTVNSEQGVPDDFEIFSPPNSKPIKRPNEITATTLNSRSVRVDNVSMGLSAGQAGVSAAARIHFVCQEQSGAVLLLKRPGHRTYLNCGLYIQRYMKRNLQSWYAFATDRMGIELEDRDIIFVYGFTKTTVWAEAAFRSGGSDVGLVLSGGALVPSVSEDIEISRMRASKPSVISRSGPPGRVTEWDRVSSTDETFDQCIFLNFYKMKKRRFWPTDSIIRAAAGYHDLPSNQDDDFDQKLDSTTMTGNKSLSGASDLEFNTIEETAFDPVNQVLDHILQNSDAEVACASDQDLCYVCQDSCLPDDIPTAMVALGISTRVDEDRIGVILPPSIAIRTPSHIDVLIDQVAAGFDTPAPIHLLSDRYADLSLQENQENTLLAFTSLRDNAGPTSNEYHQGQEDLPNESGVAVSQRRITDGFCEAQGRENIVKSLELEDWKGDHVSTFGALYLDGTFTVTKDKEDRVYQVFLFQKVLLFCNDCPQNGGKKSADKSDPPHSPQYIEGHIYLTNVTRVERICSTAQFPLDVWQQGDGRSPFCTLYFLHEEQLKQWHDCLDNLIWDGTRVYSGYSSPARGQSPLLVDNNPKFRVTPRLSNDGPLPQIDWELPESGTDRRANVQVHHREKMSSIPSQRLGAVEEDAAFFDSPSPISSEYIQYPKRHSISFRALPEYQDREGYRPMHPGSFDSSCASSAGSRSIQSRESIQSNYSAFSTSTDTSSMTSYRSSGESFFGKTKDHSVGFDTDTLVQLDQEHPKVTSGASYVTSRAPDDHHQILRQDTTRVRSAAELVHPTKGA